MAEAIYLLCAVTCAACAVLLFRGYRAGRMRLLLCASGCFAAFTANHLLLLVERMFIPSANLSILRSLVALVAMLILLYGLVWDT